MIRIPVINLFRSFIILYILLLPITCLAAQPRAGEVVDSEMLKLHGEQFFFTQSPITPEIFSRIQGKSFAKGCTVDRSQLRYITCLHRDADGNTRLGEMISNKSIADDLLSIFRELYRNSYPIERMVLIDEYDANDTRSMEANNSSCFNFRPIAGSSKLSRHSLGLAVDINPLYNPWVRVKNGKKLVDPQAGRPYANRDSSFTYKIEKGDLLHRLFLQHGFRWGGAWKSSKDYQHFEK